MFELVGWLGSFCLTFCGVPQAIKAWQTKSVNDVSFAFVTMWFAGEVLLAVYIVHHNVHHHEYQWPLWLNYGLNIVLSGYLLYLKLRAIHTAVEQPPTA